MRAFSAVVRWIAQALALLGGVALVLMMLQTVADLLMSRLFDSPIEGNLEVVSAYHMVLVVFLPLAIVELRHEHINADLFVRMLPSSLQRAIYVGGCLLSLAFFGVLGWQTLLDAMQAREINEVMMGSAYVSIWPAKFALPIGFFAIELAVMVQILKALTDPEFNPQPDGPAGE